MISQRTAKTLQKALKEKTKISSTEAPAPRDQGWHRGDGAGEFWRAFHLTYLRGCEKDIFFDD